MFLFYYIKIKQIFLKILWLLISNFYVKKLLFYKHFQWRCVTSGGPVGRPPVKSCPRATGTFLLTHSEYLSVCPSCHSRRALILVVPDSWSITSHVVRACDLLPLLLFRLRAWVLRKRDNYWHRLALRVEYDLDTQI